MIQFPSVLVLGAGASKPYGYPLGKELVVDICKGLMHPANSPLGKRLKALGCTDKEIERFRNQLSRSEVPSVDAFLESDSDYKNIGMLAITSELVGHENFPDLFPRVEGKDKPSWYRYLLNNMVESRLQDFGKNNLSIITFNYDRSLEFYFYTALINRFGEKCTEEIKKCLSSLRIVHVYGRLGGVPWEEGEITVYGPYARGPEEIRALSKQIIVMSEQQETSDLFDKARELLKSCQSIFFLGFGYHDMNLRRLGLGGGGLMNKRLHGSSFEMRKAERDRLNNIWGINTFGPDVDILGLLQGHEPLR